MPLLVVALAPAPFLRGAWQQHLLSHIPLLVFSIKRQWGFQLFDHLYNPALQRCLLVTLPIEPIAHPIELFAECLSPAAEWEQSRIFGAWVED